MIDKMIDAYYEAFGPTEGVTIMMIVASFGMSIFLGLVLSNL